MSENEKCYHELFNAVTDIIAEMETEDCNIILQPYILKLKEAQRKTEDIFVTLNE